EGDRAAQYARARIRDVQQLQQALKAASPRSIAPQSQQGLVWAQREQSLYQVTSGPLYVERVCLKTPRLQCAGHLRRCTLTSIVEKDSQMLCCHPSTCLS